MLRYLKYRLKSNEYDEKMMNNKEMKIFKN